MECNPTARPVPDVVGLLARAQAGDEHAWSLVFQHCYPKVRRALERKLAGRRRPTTYDASDLASDLFKSLATKDEPVQFDSLADLMNFLITVGERKLIDQDRRNLTLKRDIRREQSLSVDGVNGGGAIASSDPSPSQHAMAREVEQFLLESQSDEARQSIELRLAGHSNETISKETGWHPRKVQRYFKGLEDFYKSVRGLS